MAFNDWNGDGKHDSSDDYIGYQIYKDCNKNNGGGSCGFVALCVLLVVGAVLFCCIFDISEMSGTGLYILYIVGIIVVGTIIAFIKELF